MIDSGAIALAALLPGDLVDLATYLGKSRGGSLGGGSNKIKYRVIEHQPRHKRSKLTGSKHINLIETAS